MDENAEKTGKKLPTGVPFQKGDDPRRNLEGRPKGSISIITRLKQLFEEDPEEFDKFIDEYRKDPQNRKHIVEMIDGKARQPVDHQGELDLNINIIKYGDNSTL